MKLAKILITIIVKADEVNSYEVSRGTAMPRISTTLSLNQLRIRSNITENVIIKVNRCQKDAFKIPVGPVCLFSIALLLSD